VGTPVTLSGFNGIDFNQLLDAVMTQERAPLTRLETQKTTLETQNTALGTLAGKLSAMQTAVDALRDTESLSLLTATSSDTGVGVSTTSGSTAGTYSLVVNELARAQVMTSTSTYTATTDVVATGGSITFTKSGGSPVAVTLTGSTTLQGLADKINATTDIPVTASVVQSAPGTYRLMLTAKDTGVSNGFTFTKALTGGGGVTFTDTDTDGTYGETAADNTQTALDASLTVNGLAVTSASNTVSEVIPGVTLSLKKKDPALTVTVDVQRDLSGAKTVVNKFVSAYNDLVTFMKDQQTAAVAGRASIARDPLLRGVKAAIGEALRDVYAEGGTLDALGKVGVGFDINGKLTLDNDVFDDAMAAAPLDVQALFSGTDGTGGAFGALNTLLEDYTQAGGLVATARTQLTDQVSSISRRLDQLDVQLAARRTTLQRQYMEADLAMTRLKNQSGALSALGGSYRLF
jgi:flagellar hook-associated protein 2